MEGTTTTLNGAILQNKNKTEVLKNLIKGPDPLKVSADPERSILQTKFLASPITWFL